MYPITQICSPTPIIQGKQTERKIKTLLNVIYIIHARIYLTRHYSPCVFNSFVLVYSFHTSYYCLLCVAIQCIYSFEEKMHQYSYHFKSSNSIHELSRIKLVSMFLSNGSSSLDIILQFYMKEFVPHIMMTSSNGSIFRVTGYICGEFTGPRWIPLTKASDTELWYFLWSAPE